MVFKWELKQAAKDHRLEASRLQAAYYRNVYLLARSTSRFLKVFPDSHLTAVSDVRQQIRALYMATAYQTSLP
jgi:hypothetical protein